MARSAAWCVPTVVWLLCCETPWCCSNVPVDVQLVQNSHTGFSVSACWQLEGGGGGVGSAAYLAGEPQAFGSIQMVDAVLEYAQFVRS